MRILAPPVEAIADAVWASSSRTLTADPAILTAVGARTSVAASAILDLRPTAGIFRMIFLAGIGIGVECGTYDGTNFTVNSTEEGREGSGGNATHGLSFHNASGGAIFAHYGGWDR